MEISEVRYERMKMRGMNGISETEAESGSVVRGGVSNAHVERQGNFGRDEAASMWSKQTSKIQWISFHYKNT